MVGLKIADPNRGVCKMPEDKKETKQEEKAEKKEVAKEQKEKIVPAFKPITIRDYSKVIFFYPLFLYSGVT